MFKAQFKRHSPYESWTVFGSYGSEAQAISAALQKKKQGVIMVRVTDKKGSLIYSGQFMRYYFLQLIDWKIALLQKFRLFVSGESKHIYTDEQQKQFVKQWKKNK